MKKEEKEQLYQEDPFIQIMQKGVDSFVARRRTVIKILFVTVSVLLIVAALAIVNEIKTDQRRSAVDSAVTLEEMEKAANQYSGETELEIKIGIGYAVGPQKDFAKAEQWLKKAAASGNQLLKSQANAALGKVMMEQKKYDEALAAFKAARSSSAAMLGEELDWHTARCYELSGNADSAKELYSSLAAGHSVWSELASRRQAELRNVE